MILTCTELYIHSHTHLYNKKYAKHATMMMMSKKQITITRTVTHRQSPQIAERYYSPTRRRRRRRLITAPHHINPNNS